MFFKRLNSCSLSVALNGEMKQVMGGGRKKKDGKEGKRGWKGERGKREK